HIRRGLQQECRLADPGLTAEQHERSGHDAAAEDAIEFVDACGLACVLFDLDVGVEPRSAGRAARRVAMSSRSRRADAAVRRLRPLLDERVPRAAVRTATGPFR